MREIPYDHHGDEIRFYWPEAIELATDRARRSGNRQQVSFSWWSGWWKIQTIR